MLDFNFRALYLSIMTAGSTIVKDFTITWAIENLYMSPKQNGEFITSCLTEIKIFHCTKWCLILFPRGKEKDDEEYISCFLERSKDDGVENIEIEFELCVNADTAKMKHNFQKEERQGFNKFLKRELWNRSHTNSFVLKCHMRLLNRIKTEEHMWVYPNQHLLFELGSSDETLKEISSIIDRKELMMLDKKLLAYPNRCFVQTKYETRKRTMKIPIANLVFPATERYQQILVSPVTSWLMFLITIGCDLEDNVDHLRIKIRVKDKLTSNSFTICKVDLLDSSNEICYSAEDDHLFKTNHPDDVWYFQHSFQWENLKTIDNGSIRFEFTISLALQFMEGHYSVDIEGGFPLQIEKQSESKKEMFRFYRERKFCDVSLHTTGKTFEVHKTVLAAMSPIFDVMFTSDMSEGNSNIVHIDDLDAGVVSRMLDFLYTENIKLVEFENAMELYSAADKYLIVPLKNICRNFLKNNLTAQNVCSVVSLADAHNDEVLKKSVISYIHSNKNDVLCSSQWEALANSNARTALEILQRVCLKSS